MTTDRTDIHDPADVELDKVLPKPSLGSTFEKAANSALLFSTKSRVWGDKHPSAVEPTEPEFERQDLRRKTLVADGHRCMFCGFYSSQNQVHNLSDNHRDVRAENLRAADHLCHGWNHLGELGEGNAVIAYLPGLSGQDANHLQRTIIVAVQSDDPAVREDAKKLLNWMASHRDYAKDAWGTSDPAVFAEAIVRLEEEDREKREVVFQDLAVVFNPGPYTQVAATWARESYGTLPVGKWGQVYHDVMNAPA
ncbi:MAG: IncI1 plasmid conjugative transfer protein TraT [uncultured Paraburkholderia sp.]|nr:MAG: IncI1 plasmid conjugative transfer protein TraT [uncultured Paraburkholderia sp.]